MTTSRHPIHSFPWQGEKRFTSRDRIWILTDAEHYESAMYGQSIPQQWYRVGAIDLTTMKSGYFLFSTDDVRAMMRAGVPPAPWKQSHAMGIELTRFHQGGQEKGRFSEKVALIDLDAELVSQGPALRSHFERNFYFQGNSTPGMWQKIEQRAAELRAIETAALSMTDWFAAGDVRKTLGKDVNVTRTLALLVGEGRLHPNGKKKRGARYVVSPPKIVERADWSQ